LVGGQFGLRMLHSGVAGESSLDFAQCPGGLIEFDIHELQAVQRLCS